jgi:DNA-binding winged helix-turn-helix (wHTH) protein
MNSRLSRPIDATPAWTPRKRIFEFGRFRLDASLRELRVDVRVLRLPPRLIDLLLFLIERRDSLVTREELLEALWPNTVVEEGGLNRNISQLRKILGDESGSSEQFIETIPRRGYRFVAPVTELDLHASVSEPPPVSALAPEPVSTSVAEPEAPRTVPRSARTWLLVGAGVAALCVLAFLYTWQKSAGGGSATTAPSEYRLREVTHNAAALPITAAAVSRDGKMLAYVDGGHIKVRDLASKEVSTVAGPAGVSITHIEWLYDSMQLLVKGMDPATHLTNSWLMSAFGGAPRLLVEDVNMATLSADGRQLAYIRNRFDIWLANADGTNARLIGGADQPEEPRHWLSFSRDGEYLLFGQVVHGAGRYVIESIRIRDGHRTVLFDSPQMLVAFAVAGPDQLLVVVRDLSILDALRSGGFRAGVSLINLPVSFASGKQGPSRVLGKWEDAWILELSTSEDQRRIAFVKDSMQSDAYVGELLKGNSALGNVRRLTLDDRTDRPAGWLDDRTALFHSSRSGTYSIYRQDLDEPDAGLVVGDRYENRFPVASLDGQWIYYFARLTGDSSLQAVNNLMRVPVNGGPVELVDARRDAYRALRCPAAGSWCVLSERIEPYQVMYRFDMKRGKLDEIMRIERTPGFYLDWAISPDASTIALIDSVGDDLHNRIFLRSIATGETREIEVEGHRAFRSIVWSRDGQGLFVAASGGDEGMLLHVTLEGRASVLRRQLRNADTWGVPSPDGRHLLFQEWTSASNVMLMER